MSNNPYDDTHNSPPEHVDHPVRPEVGAHTQKDDVDSRTILLAGSFLALFVVVLVLAVIAFFHHYRHVLEAQKEATVSAGQRPSINGKSHRFNLIGWAKITNGPLSALN